MTFAVLAANAQAISHSICSNDVRVKRYFVQNPVQGMTYTWNVSGGGVVLPSSSDTLYVDWGTVPGIYAVSLYGVLNASCETDTVVYLIEVLPIPSLQILGNSNVCVGEKITLNATGANQIVWSNGHNGNTSDFFPSGNTTVWAVGNNGTCYSDTAFFNLTPIPLPSASFTLNPTEGEAPLKVSFFDQSTNASSYFWDFGNGLTSTEQNPTNLYLTPGSYSVTLVTENSAGCSDSMTFEFVVVNDGFTWFIPNSFTPNGDNSNEIFRPYFPDFVEYTLGIFDRWGNVIYQSTSVDGSWDGMLDKKPVLPGVYVYRLAFRLPNDQKQIVKTGSVTLLR